MVQWQPMLGYVQTQVGEVVEAWSHGCAAVQLMRDGGNAMDAAICAALCVGVVNAQSSGIGGGGFLVVRDGSG